MYVHLRWALSDWNWAKIFVAIGGFDAERPRTLPQGTSGRAFPLSKGMLRLVSSSG